MTLTPLFIITMVALLVAAVVSFRIHKKSLRPRQREGPVPGYSVSHGEEVAFKFEKFDHEGEWFIWLVEEFHSPSRSRLVVTLHLEDSLDDDEVESLARDVAFEFQTVHHVDVVVVSCIDSGGGTLLRHLYAPDGLGWAAEVHRSRLTLDLR